MAAALAIADPELTALIAQQAAERSNSVGHMVSLDALDVYGRSWYELVGDPWDDPTFEAAAARLERQFDQR